MAHMATEPAVSVTTLERALRQLMGRELRREYGPGWLARISTPEQRDVWQGRHDDEVTRRPGVVAVPAVGLEYSELYELIEIAGKHWGPLAKALGKKAKMLPLLEHFERVRNTASHSRDLMPFERDLMSGISGEIRNKVTLHMTTTDPDGDPYPRIESATDAFGNTIEIAPELTELAGGLSRPLALLHPGDAVKFTCTGVDPRGRDLDWWLTSPSTPGLPDPTAAPSGQPVELIWEVQDRDIIENNAVHIYMGVTGANYHRAHGFDHRVYFTYRVRDNSAAESTNEAQ